MSAPEPSMVNSPLRYEAEPARPGAPMSLNSHGDGSSPGDGVGEVVGVGVGVGVGVMVGVGVGVAVGEGVIVGVGVSVGVGVVPLAPKTLNSKRLTQVPV